MSIVEFPKPPEGPFTPQIHGPFPSEYYVTVDGYRVPYITAKPLEDGRIDVVVDNRMSIEPVSRDEFNRWMYIVANAMAVAAGYSSHGKHCEPVNKFKVKMSRIGDDG